MENIQSMTALHSAGHGLDQEGTIYTRQGNRKETVTNQHMKKQRLFRLISKVGRKEKGQDAAKIQ